MNFKQAIKVLNARKQIASSDEAEALSLAIDLLLRAVCDRQDEINKAVSLIRDAVFDSEGKLNKGAWRYLKDRIDFPPEDKAEIIKRLGLTGKE